MKHIQEEYQKYMERVRSKAQGSIDQANIIFQAKRHELTIHVDNIVAFMQQRFLSVQARTQAAAVLNSSHMRRLSMSCAPGICVLQRHWQLGQC